MYSKMSPDERETRAVISSDQCIIDSQIFCIRGCLNIPIIGTDEVFSWGLWAQVDEAAFNEIRETWLLEGREKTVGPFDGKLLNRLSAYPDNTRDLRVKVQIRPVGERPLFFVEDQDHPLAIQQRQGMFLVVAERISSRLLHPQT
jgi:hypothetical protein